MTMKKKSAIRQAGDMVFQSWKSTFIGFMTMVTLAWGEIGLYFDGDPATVGDWNIVAAAVFAFVLGLVSRDNNVSSEQAGAK